MADSPTVVEQFAKMQDLIQNEARNVATDVYNDLGTQFGVATVPVHVHAGTDSPQIDFSMLSNVALQIPHTVQGTNAATAANYSTFYIAQQACVLIGVQEVHATASTSGTLQIEKLTGTTAPGVGTNMLSTTISLSSTANTVQTGTVSNTLSARQLAKGDRIALKVAGTLTSQANVTVVITLQF